MSKLNVLLITSDQQHWHTLGQNNPEIQTPALDKLAAQGTTFTRAYCPNPTCTPTRSSMITGKYPSQHGAYSLGTKLPESPNRQLGDHFQAQLNIASALSWQGSFPAPAVHRRSIPRWNLIRFLQDLDFWQDFEGPFYGFDHIELARNHTDEAHVGQHYALWMEEKGLTNWRDYYLQPTGHVSEQRRKWHHPRTISLQRLDRRAQQGPHFGIPLTGPAVFLMGELFRSASQIPGARTLGYHVRSGGHDRARAHTGRAREQGTRRVA